MKTLRLTCAAAALLAMSACSWPSAPLTVDEQVQSLESDLGQLYAQQDALDHPLTLSEAIARGIKYNINHRVAMMDELVAHGEVDTRLLEMLPGLDLEAGYQGRDRNNVISAESDATGAQSLEPSIFQDQHRKTAALNLSWNTLDAGMAYVRSREASDKSRIALERRRKVVQTITQDVRYAYWRAASAQLLDSHIDDLMARADALNKKLAEEELKKSSKDTAVLLDLQKNLYETMRDLMVLRRDLATARTELASLINLPPHADFEIASSEGDMMALDAVPALKTPLQDLEVLALFIRPEMREQMLLKRVAARGARAAVLQSMPGIGGALGYNYDGNTYLKDEEWTSFSLGLTQSLMKLFTLPVRLKNEHNKEKLADLRRMAMVATVLMQMNVAHTQYTLSKEDYDLMKRLLGVNQRILENTKQKAKNTKAHDVVLEGQQLQAEMDHLLTRTGLHMAYANTENAFGKIISTIGLDPLPPHVEEQSLADLTDLVGKRYDNLDENVIKALLNTVREQTNLLNADAVQAEPAAIVTPAAAVQETQPAAHDTPKDTQASDKPQDDAKKTHSPENPDPAIHEYPS